MHACTIVMHFFGEQALSARDLTGAAPQHASQRIHAVRGLVKQLRRGPAFFRGAIIFRKRTADSLLDSVLKGGRILKPAHRSGYVCDGVVAEARGCGGIEPRLQLGLGAGPLLVAARSDRGKRHAVERQHAADFARQNAVKQRSAPREIAVELFVSGKRLNFRRVVGADKVDEEWDTQQPAHAFSCPPCPIEKRRCAARQTASAPMGSAARSPSANSAL